MPVALALPATDSLYIKPWPDPVIDRVGHDPRSAYVEHFWLGILGPSTTWLLRRMAANLEAAPAGFDLPLADTARALGIGGDGASSPFVRALGRCCQFQLASAEDDNVLVVRRKLPPLNRRQLARLPEPVRADHQRWLDRELATPALEKLRRRSRCLALSLLELGEDLEATERQLLRWRFHPSLCHESAAWAWERHTRALAEANRRDASPPSDAPLVPAGRGPAAA